MTHLKPVAVLLAVLTTAGLNAAGPDHRLADAVEQRNAALVTSLVKQGADVNGAQPDGATALHWAAYWDDAATLDLLIRSGARADATNDLGSARSRSPARTAHADIVERLLAAGANPNAATTTGVTALMTAARGGSLGAVKALIARGADVNATEPSHGQTALMWAVSQRHRRRGADPDRESR